MRLDALSAELNFGDLGRQMHALAARLYPICRSITGDGVRETLAVLGEYFPLKSFEVPSGTEVFDWTVPREWTIRDAYIKNSRGERVVDFRKSNLHVMGYSIPFHGTLSLSELKPFLHSLPDHPDWVPFRSSFYQDKWGFCLTQRQLDSLPEDQYEVHVDSSLEAGHLTYAECFLPGQVKDEVLLFAHVCHPSLANDNLSGLAVASQLAQILGRTERRLSYRLVFCPTVIGAITWLHQNQTKVGQIKHGMTLALLGDAGGLTYKKSRRGDAAIDRALTHVLARSGRAHSIKDFSPYGYDERQFCSPGFNLPMGCLMRSPNGTFPEYHTSGDNLDFIKAEALAESLQTCLAALAILEGNGFYLNQNPMCEPRLGKRGVFEGLKGKASLGDGEMALLWVLNYSDGENSLLDIANRSGLGFAGIRQAADVLERCGLLKPSVPG